MKCDVYRTDMTRKKKIIPVESESKNLELKKHVAVIHSQNGLTLVQRKIANALLFNAYSKLQEQEDHEIHISKLCELIGYDSHDTKPIKDALIRLLSTVLEWNLIDKDRKNEESVWSASSIIASATIDGPICTYSYSNTLRKLLYHPDVYGRLCMRVQAMFKSAYGLALYENCNRYQDIGQTPWLDMAKFRKLMGVNEGKYKIFRDFKSRVLDKAVAEVNKYSSLFITPKLRKQSRQVVAIQFLIEATKQKQPMFVENNQNDSLTEVLEKRFKLSLNQINQILSNYEEDYIKEKIILIENSSSYKNGKIKNITRYLLTALKQNFQQEKLSDGVIKTDGKAVTKDYLYTEQKEIQERHHEYNRFVDSELPQLLVGLPDADKDQIFRSFDKFMNAECRGVYKNLYVKDGLNHPLVKYELCRFIKREFSNIIKSKLLSFDDWLEQIYMVTIDS